MRPAPTLAVRLSPLLLAALAAGCEEDISDIPAALKVVKSQPFNGEAGVSPDIVLRVEFDDEVDPASITSKTLVLEPAATGSPVAEGRFLTFNPDLPLAQDTQYLAQVEGALKGKKGGTLGGKYGFRFTTRGTHSDILPPAPVTDLAATVKSGTSVGLTWSASGDDGVTGTATRYDLRWASASACPIKPENFAGATALPLPTPRPTGTDESTTVPNLPRKAFVCFALKVVDDSGNTSGLSNVVTLTLPDLVPPNPPVVSLATSSENSADLTWKAVGDDADEGLATDYTLYRHAGSPCEVLTPSTAVMDGGTCTALELPFPGPPGSDELYSAAGLTRDSDYCFLLRVRDTGGNAAWSNVLPVHTPDLTPPSSPAISVSVAMPTSLVVEWTAVGDDGMGGTVTREELEVAEGPCPSSTAAFTPTLTLPSSPVEGGSGSSLTVQGLKTDLDHCFRLVVEDNAGAVVKSNLAEGHTQDIVAPGAPALAVSSVGNSSAELSWTAQGDNDAAGNAAEEEVRMGHGVTCDTLAPGTFSQGDLVTQQTPPSPGTAQTLSLGGLTADEEYCVLLRVKDEAGLSSYSQVVRFKTLDLVPPAEPQLFVVDGGVGADRVALEWQAVGDNGLTGRATAQSLRYAAGEDCVKFGTDAGVAGTGVALPPPLQPLAYEAREVLGLDEDTLHCFQLSVEDEVGNGVRSAVALATTKDATAPAVPVLVAQALPAGVSYQWRAVCENRNHPSCGLPGYGTAAEYRFVYRRAATDGSCPVAPAGQGQQVTLRGSCGSTCAPGTVCAALGTDTPSCKAVSSTCGSTCDSKAEACVSTGAGSACAVKLLSQSVDVAAPGTQQEVKVEGLPVGSTWCGQVVVKDEAGNSAFSNEARNDKPIGSEDLTPPSTVGNFRATLSRGIDTLDLAWTAPGDDSTVGTATSYDVYMATGADCVVPGQGDAFLPDAGTVQAVQLVNATPLPAGTAQTDRTSVQNLDTLGTAACFRLRATDEAGNASALSNLAFPPKPISDLAAATGATGDVELGWTASGANDEQGTASRYELHVRTVPVGLIMSCPTNGPDVLALPSGLTPSFNTTGPSAAATPETGSISGITPGTSLCLVLEAFNLSGDSALSNVATLTLADTVPPANFALSLSAVSSTTANMTFTFTGDDGTSGSPAKYELGMVQVTGTVAAGVDPCACDPNAGVSCPADKACLGSQCVALFTNPLEVQPSGALTVKDLDPDTHHCAQMRAVDDEGNAGFTPVLHVKTDQAGAGGDVDPPAKPVLAAFSPGDVRSTSSSTPEADLAWTAVAEDGTDNTSAAVTNYAVLYRATKADGTSAVTGQSDCDGLNALGDGAKLAASSVSVAVGSPQVGDPLTANDTVFTGAVPEQPLCVALLATDAANNSALSAWRYVRDNTAPGELLNFHVAAVGRTSVTLKVDAPGDDGTDGQATAYQLRVKSGECPSNKDDFDTTLAPVGGTPVPGSPGSMDTLTASGLTTGATYCLHLVAVDDVGLRGPAIMQPVTLPAASAFDLQEVRKAVTTSATLATHPTTQDPDLTVFGATVTYLKPDLSAGRPGAAPIDTQPGFFIQGAAEGPAVFVQLDPATAGPGGGALAVGDRVDLADIDAKLMLPDGTKDQTGVVVITSATVTKKATCVAPAVGAPDPCGPGFTCNQAGACLLTPPQDLDGVAANGLLDFEHELVAADLTLKGAGVASEGFVTFPAQLQVGTSLPLKVTDAVASALQLAPDMELTVLAPLWREGAEFQVAAWRKEDLVQVPPAFALTSPLEGAVNVALNHSPITLVLNRPHLATTLPDTSSSPSCGSDDLVQLSADDFTTCVGMTVTDTGGFSDNQHVTLTPTAPLIPGKRYQVRVTTNFTGLPGVESRLGFVTVPAATCTDRQLVISQVFPSSGTIQGFTNDFVELHNRSSVDWDLAANPLFLAVADKDGTTWNTVDVKAHAASLSRTTLPAGSYLSINLAPGSDLDPTAGMVALFGAASDVPASGACPAAGKALDLLGYGTGLLCSEGRPMPSPSLGQSLLRQLEGCVDHGNNAADFFYGAPLSRSFSSTAATCYCGGGGAADVTSSAIPDTMDYCRVGVIDGTTNVSSATLTSPSRAYLQLEVYENSVTEAAGQNPNIRVEFGMVPVSGGTVPSLYRWTFLSRSYYREQVGNNEWYEVCDPTVPSSCLPGLATPAQGTWRFVARVTSSTGAPKWTYCDADGSGSNAGLSFSLSNAGSVTVAP